MDDVSATINVGKGGLSEPLIKHIRLALSKHDAVKLKFLRSSREKSDRRKLAEDAALKCGTVLLDVRGNTCLLMGRKKD
ncbi:CRS1 / YhbY (CRM) domain protein [uncultured archaeon]|nr:CRS1 / YhbY (CRM) domain protein [uncultured archaeon]